MKHSIFYSVITAAMAISIAACSPGTDVAGVGGSGITSTGTITGFGSIYVNDIEFFTSSSTFDIDDNPDLTEDDLAIGMRVTVKGTLNDDGITGNATSVTYDDELQGPIGSVSDVEADGISRTITVLGIVVALNSTTTKFDDRNSSPGGFSFDNIREGDNVEISGLFDSAGVLIATRIELKDKVFKEDKSIVELKGTIANLIGSNFTLNLYGMTNVTVDVDASGKVHYDDLPGGLAEGAFVEVKGTCPDITCDTVTATRIEGESDGYDDDENEVDIEGFITRYESISDFDVDGLPVDASTARLEPDSLVLDVDLRVEVEGTVVNNVLVASKVKLEDD
jgi:hypothetical protein